MNVWTDVRCTQALHLLADWSMQWAVLIALAGIVLILVRPRRVATRLLLCQLVFIGGLLLPLMPACWGPVLSPVTEDPPAVEAAPPTAPPLAAVPAPEAHLVMASAPPATSPPPPSLPMPPTVEKAAEPAADAVPAPPSVGGILAATLMALWLAGVVFLAGRLVLGWVWLARLRHGARPVGAAALAEWHQCRNELAVRRRAVLLVHAGVWMPVLLGGLRPAVIVPPHWEELPPDHCRTALLHELLHLAHGDDWAKVAEEIVRVFFFFHPLVHWLLNCLEGERERRCDAAVIHHGVAPRFLARLLLDYVGQLGPGQSAFALGQALPFFNRITVKDRIHQLLKEDTMHWTTPLSGGRKALLVTTMLGLMIVLGGFGVRAGAPAEKPAPPAEKPKVEEKPAVEKGIVQGTFTDKAFSVGFTQEKPAMVKGIVKDDAGQPVAGAIVILYGLRSFDQPETGQTYQALTGTDGGFVFTQKPGGQPSKYAPVVLAAKEGFAPAMDHTSWDREELVKLTLTKPAAIEGTVKDREGRPVAGARVQFGTVHRFGNGSYWGYAPGKGLRESPLERFFCTRTDTQGKFRFITVPAEQELIFRAEAEGFADEDSAGNGLRETYFARPGTSVALVLTPEARIDGRVVSRVPGVKVENLFVLLHGEDRENWNLNKLVETDKEGRFSLRGLAGGDYTVQMDVPPAETAWTARAAAKVTLRPGQVSTVEVELIEGVLVEGKVTLEGTKKTVAGATVSVHGPSYPEKSRSYPQTTTDAEGRYRFRLPPGPTEFFLQGAPQGFLILSARNLTQPVPVGFVPPASERNHQHVIIPEGPRTFTGPTLEVQKAAVLQGRVVDVRGRPVPQAQVIGLCRPRVPFPPPAPSPRVGGPQVVTDGQGRFRLERGGEGPFLQGEAVELQIVLPGGQVYEVSTIAAAEPPEVQLPAVVGGNLKGQADVKPEELAGIVVDEQGKPLEGVHVHVWDWVDRPENQAHTGKDGIFRIKDCGRDKKVQVRFRKPGYSPVMFMQQPTGVKDLVVAMDSKTYFEGVVRGPDGKPASGALIRADQGPKQGDRLIIPTVWTDTATDAAGRYRLYVEPDAYQFMVKAPGVGAIRLPKTAIAHGQARQLDIQLEPGVTFRAVTVDSLTGQPVAGVRLFHWQQKDVEGRSNARGEIAISEMIPGKFDFWVEATGYTRWWSDETMSEWNHRKIDNTRLGWQRNFDSLDFDLKPGMAPVKIVLGKGVRITGRIVDPDGKPVAGATVAPALTGTGNSLTGDTRFSVPTKADGTFDMLLPASGEARYNLVAHDGKYSEWRQWANGVLPPIRTVPGQEINGLTLTLTRPVTVRGKVVDGRGKPVARREVRAHPTDKLENRYYDPNTTTADDGTFELRFIRPGDQCIQVAPFWLEAEQAPAGTSRTVHLAAGKTVGGIDLVAADQGQ